MGLATQAEKCSSAASFTEFSTSDSSVSVAGTSYSLAFADRHCLVLRLLDGFRISICFNACPGNGTLCNKHWTIHDASPTNAANINSCFRGKSISKLRTPIQCETDTASVWSYLR